MPMISILGRRRAKTRVLLAAMYLLLAAGAVTMLYPFLLMVAGATKTGVDAADRRLVPAFLTDDAALYRKHLEGLHNESLAALRVAYDRDWASWEHVPPPAPPPAGLVEVWRAFAATTPAWQYTLGYLYTPVTRGAAPHNLRAFRRELESRYGRDLARMNAALGTGLASWTEFFVQPEDFLQRRQRPGADGLAGALAGFKARQPVAERVYFSVEGFYRRVFLPARYGRDLAALNRARGAAFSDWGDVPLPARAPRDGAARADWESFVREVLNPVWLRADADAAAPYRAYLLARYGDLATLNARYHTAYTAPGDIPLPSPGALAGLRGSDWDAFVQGWREAGAAGGPARLHQLPLEHIRLATVEQAFRDFVRDRFGTPDAAGRALGLSLASWEALPPGQAALQDDDFLRRRPALRREFASRNLRSVLDFVGLHGRAIRNTVIYCGLAILLALIVNPMAAYALSRFRPASTPRILLFLMLTMAFPPMITQMPVFLMLRSFGLLNTYWALVLPAMANGYTIFLLKGFFDSLPREVYESAQLDGAGEFRMFWQFTLGLSTPILAVTALNAFTAAYGNFMMALLVCQDQRMWTLMPWLYEFQQRSGAGVVYASLLVAALPTLAVFLLCQRIIMRGIVVPVEK